MLKKFNNKSGVSTLPLSFSISSSFKKVRADLAALKFTRQIGEPYRRRHCLIFCKSSILSDAIIYKAFQGTEIYFLDWLGQPYDRETVCKAITSQMEKMAQYQAMTICIFDTELANKQQLQIFFNCVENARDRVTFVLQSSSDECQNLVKNTPIVFDCTKTCTDDQYVASSSKFLWNILQKEKIFNLKEELFSDLSSQIAEFPPDLLETLAKEAVYTYVEQRVDDKFQQIDDYEQVFLAKFIDTAKLLKKRLYA